MSISESMRANCGRWVWYNRTRRTRLFPSPGVQARTQTIFILHTAYRFTNVVNVSSFWHIYINIINTVNKTITLIKLYFSPGCVQHLHARFSTLLRLFKWFVSTLEFQKQFYPISTLVETVIHYFEKKWAPEARMKHQSSSYRNILELT